MTAEAKEEDRKYLEQRKKGKKFKYFLSLTILKISLIS